MNPQTIFISYNGADRQWAEWIGWLLEEQGVQVILQHWDFRPGNNWVLRMQEAIRTSDRTLIVLSDNFLSAEYTQPEWAAAFAQDPRGDHRKLLPVRIKECDPDGLLGQIVWVDLIGLTEDEALQALLDGLEERGKPDKKPIFPGTPIPDDKRATPLRTPQPTKIRVSVANLPITKAIFLGRQDELTTLDQAWTNPKTHIVSVVAPGGVGKTALVNTWLGKMATEDYRGARRVYGWSFYSQGAGESKAASGDAFIAEALAFFGDEDPEADSPWQRGERLASLIRNERTLLVLDGLEPLQEPPRTGLPAGRLKDPGLQALLRNLAASNNGLCLITTREKVEDLDPKVGSTVERLDLNELPPEAGAAVLRTYDLDAPEDELQEISKAFAGHALALTLLGPYLRDFKKGDVRKWKEVRILQGGDPQTKHAQSVMASYESRLGKGPEVALLNLLGLFDRPASQEEVAALLESPAIRGLTDAFFHSRRKQGLSGWFGAREYLSLDEEVWGGAVARLREARLLSTEGGLGKEGGLDAHPLVRTYFGERLEKERPKAFKAGHLRLYEHLKQAAPEYPDTLEEMQPLFHAVIHGCRAGRVQEAYREVYRQRIQRGDTFYTAHKLGAFGSDLAALSGFFEQPWYRPAAELPEGERGFVLNAAGFRLRAQGRLAEAVAPMRAALKSRKQQGNWKNGAINAGNLSELLLTLGKVGEAVSTARESVALADRSGDAEERMVNRTTLADALHQAGRVEEARALFEEAESMKAEDQPEYPLLDSLRGYRYCDLLLALTPPTPLSQPSPPPSRERGELAPAAEVASDVASLPDSPLPGVREGVLGEGPGVRAIHERAEQTLTWARRVSSRPLTIALGHLTLGRTHLHLALAAGGPQPDPAHLAQATDHLDSAMDGLRKSGHQWMEPLGLLARAGLWRWTDQPEKATADLDEAFEIADRGGMRLHLTDAHLERARLRVHVGEIEKARADVEAAQRLVEETGYRRRDGEVAALTAILEGRTPPGDESPG